MTLISYNFDQFLQKLDVLPRHQRSLIAIAGPPGSGKSWLASKVNNALNTKSPQRAAILPMDGYHYDDAILKAQNRLAFKGAPDTFDVGGLYQMLQRLKQNSESAIAVPVFDRRLEISRGSARFIAQQIEIVLVEGNYLLLDQAPWATLADFFDQKVFVTVSEQTCRERLVKRWQGFQLDEAAIHQKLEKNDLPNGRFVREHSRKNADIFVNNSEKPLPS